MSDIYINDWPPFSPQDQNRRRNVLEAARLMVNAAMTAPNAGGVSQVETHIVHGYKEQMELARKMEEMASWNPVMDRLFKYEAVMVRESDCVLLFGDFRAAETPMDASCGGCGGRGDCSFVYERRTTALGQIDMTQPRRDVFVDGPLCTVRVGDLGFAMGAAVFMGHRLLVDTRPFATVGMAAKQLGYCPDSPIVVGVLVAALAKNPYVDINTDYHLHNQSKLIDSVRKQYSLARQAGADYRLSDPGYDRWRERVHEKRQREAGGRPVRPDQQDKEE
jgi:uncharacterized ferredoxin-like protein